MLPEDDRRFLCWDFATVPLTNLSFLYQKDSTMESAQSLACALVRAASHAVRPSACRTVRQVDVAEFRPQYSCLQILSGADSVWHIMLFYSRRLPSFATLACLPPLKRRKYSPYCRRNIILHRHYVSRQGNEELVDMSCHGRTQSESISQGYSHTLCTSRFSPAAYSMPTTRSRTGARSFQEKIRPRPPAVQGKTSFPFIVKP